MVIEERCPWADTELHHLPTIIVVGGGASCLANDLWKQEGLELPLPQAVQETGEG